MLNFTKNKWFVIVGFIIALATLVTAETKDEESTSSHRSGKLNGFLKSSTFETSSTDSPYIIVSTLDGKVSALDTKNGGTVAWSVDIGQGPLVSSSISKLQINQNGKLIRLIPSLSGGLFQFDGNSVEALPFTADQLLSSSFKVSDDSILVGGNEVTTFGLDSSNGKVVYFCSASGCETLMEASPGSNIIIIKRRQKTVRSVQNRNGIENWNFTVGEVELDLSKGKSYQLIENSGEGEHNGELEEDEDISDHSATKCGKTFESAKSSVCNFLKKMKVFVPEGAVCVSENDEVQWKHKFTSPIANAWFVNGDTHQKIDLFDPNMVPALHEKNKKDQNVDPTIYMGFFNTHAYIQVSSMTREAISESTTSSHLIASRSPFRKTIKFPYRPYLGTSEHLEKAVVGEAKEGEIAVYAKTNGKGKCGKTLAVYQDNDKNTDTGYYFKTDFSFHFGPLSESRRKGRTTELNTESDAYSDSNIYIVYASFIYYWREILVIIVTTVVVTLILNAKHRQMWKVHEEETSKSNSSNYADAVTDIHPQRSDVPAVFESRYLKDFEPIRCLGKGGFGVVFESLNKVDQCSYAIKRIRLPHKPTAREKVMREVRVLATLDHSYIVRYFNAWTEEPPHGWQEKVDKELMQDISSYASSGSFLPGSTDVDVNKNKSRHENEYIDNGDTQPFTLSKSAKLSEGFSEETRSFSMGIQNTWSKRSEKPYIGGKFFNSVGSDSNSELCEVVDSCADVDNIPFSKYKDDSFDIVFEPTKDNRQTNTSDSAIVEDVCGSRHRTKNHTRNISDCTELPKFDDIYKNTQSPRSQLRKRSSSQKLQIGDESDTGSELNAVVCREPEEDNEKRKNDESQKSKIGAPMYLYIQMQLCQKESLRVWLENNHTRDDKYCLWIFHQVLSAVEYVHDNNLIHRDLKPSNIFFSSDGVVKVGDFGLVTETEELNDNSSNTDIETTVEYVTYEGTHTEKVGTRLYMAPEQMRGRNYNQKVDIFALGLILIEMFTSFSTKMERILEMTKARQSKFDKKFIETYPNEAKLARQMLSGQPVQRPTANEAISNNIFQNKEYLSLQFHKRARTISGNPTDA